VNTKRAEVMVSFDDRARWWDRDGGFVSVDISLHPAKVRQRAEQWLWNENHSMGKFVRMGLEEYLSEVGPQRAARIQRFEQALVNARQLAQPLVRINAELMQRIHPNKDQLSVQVACEQFPFPPTMSDVRAVVERVMFNTAAPDGGWFMAGNTAGVESRLMTAVLDNAVQPAAVTSLSEPISQRWDQITRQPLNLRQDAIRGFWTYNRARLITESIPLPPPSVRKIATGWFTGRLLGLVTDATETEGFKVHYKENSFESIAPLPWPLLNHRDENDLHMKSHQTEWLPALLEHVGLAMMLFGQNPAILDGYEQLYRLGARSSSVMEAWILDAVLPTSTGSAPQIQGLTAEERKANATRAIEVLSGVYEKRRAETVLAGEWDRFVQVPFGYELFPMMIDTLSALGSRIKNIETEQVFG
jgi:hypothetical protein